MGKVHRERVLPGYVRRPVPSYRLPLLFQRAGLEDISVSGYLCAFSPSDARLGASAGHAWLVAGADAQLAQVRTDFSEHAGDYDAGGLGPADRARVLDLLAQRLEWIRSHPKTALRAWTMELRPRLIVTGRKPPPAAA